MVNILRISATPHLKVGSCATVYYTGQLPQRYHYWETNPSHSTEELGKRH